MRLEFEPNASAVPFVEKDSVNQDVSQEIEKMLREGVKAAQEGRRAEARKMLLQVTEEDANSENAWLWLASISEYPEELLVFLNNVLRINPNNERALEWYKATKSLLAKTLVQRGADAIKDDRQAFARQCFEQAIEHEAENELAWLWMASIADAEEEKVACFEKVLAINPQNQDAKTSVQQIQTQKTQKMFADALAAAVDGRHADAHAMLDAVLERDAEMEDAWTLKSHIAASFEERAECFLKLRAINPENEMANAALASWKSLAERVERQPQPVQDDEPVAEFAEETAAEKEEDVLEVSEAADFAPAEVAAPESLHMESLYADDFAENPTEELNFDAAFQPSAEETAEEILSDDAPKSFDEAEAESEPVSFASNDEPDVLEQFTKLQNDLTSELEETEMNWAFDEGKQRREPEDYFRNFEDSEDIHRTQTADAHETFVSGGEVEDEVAMSFEAPEESVAEESNEEESVETAPQAFFEYAPAAAEVSFSDREPEAAAEPEFFYEEPTAEEKEEAQEVFEAAPEMKADAPEMYAEYNYLHQFTNMEEESLSAEEHVSFGEQTEENATEETAAEAAADEGAEQSAEVFEEEPIAYFEAQPVVHVEEQPAAYFEEQPAAAPFVQAAEPRQYEEYPTPKHEMMLCPFCTTENDKQAFACVSCRTILTLSDLEMLLNQHSADVEKVAPAIASLESENESFGLQAEQLANLGIGHLNLKNYRQGFHYLQEAVRQNPSNVILDAQVNALAIRLTELEEQQTAHEGMAKNRRILVVDDSPTVRKLIAGKLEKSGHEVICAVDGLDAMQKIGEMTPDLILLDITMPRMDGYQVCKLIRSTDSTKDVPVVMISGKDGFFDKVRGRMAGTTGYITKPFGPETLMKTVETYLN